MDKKFYEIQLRTYAQDIWANLVESLSNGDNTLKYGGSENEQALVQILNRLSEKFFLLDEIAHTISLKNYRKKIQEVMQNVLSNRA
jgi:ppGpp synthetase/RelA/SpoT-type nucleotidyltranferase